MTATVHHRRSRAPAAANRTAAKVAALVAATPDIDTTTVAAQLGVSTRTARRHLATHRGPLAAATRAATTSDDRTAADAPP
ncbi:MAG: hypothetical protein HOV79_24370 [Hamadaea sp.]|nr:hypothetical protein [Hamadaea sp.]